MVEFGNIFYYVLTEFILIGLTIGSVYLVKNKSDKFITIFIFSLFFSAFVLHFVKLSFEPYSSNFPKSLRNITFENICAVSTLLFPWLYLTKSRLMKDYIIVMGFMGGLGAVVFPYQAVGFSSITLDILRFYFDHFILFLAPFLMVYTKQYTFNIKGVFLVPIMFYAVLALIFINEVILVALGIVGGNLTTILDPETRNAALIFGPNKHLVKYSWLYDAFVPNVFKTIPFGPNAGTKLYWPIFWLVIPSYIYIVITGILSKIFFNIVMRKKVFQFNSLTEMQTI